MTLTNEELKALQRPFRYAEHEFKPPHGFVYVAEGAVTSRIEEIDPAWELRVVNVTVRSEVVTAIVRLTIAGVTRDGVGMQSVELTKDGKREANEAEKAAATDALRRAARLFGVGRYLLDCPVRVNDEVSKKQFGAWLAELQRAAGVLPPKTEAPAVEAPALPVTVITSANPVQAMVDALPGPTRPTIAGPAWDAGQAKAWANSKMAQGHNLKELMQALGVSARLSEFQGSQTDANAVFAWWLNQQLAAVEM